MNSQVWIDNEKRKIIVSDMPILPIGFQLLKSYEDWQTAVRFADTFNIALHYDIEYDNDYTRNNWEEEDDDDEQSDDEIQEMSNRKVYQDYYKGKEVKDVES